MTCILVRFTEVSTKNEKTTNQRRMFRYVACCTRKQSRHTNPTRLPNRQSSKKYLGYLPVRVEYTYVHACNHTALHSECSTRAAIWVQASTETMAFGYLQLRAEEKTRQDTYGACLRPSKQNFLGYCESLEPALCPARSLSFALAERENTPQCKT